MDSTSIFGLKQTSDNEQWRNSFDYQNDNMDMLDDLLDAIHKGIGVVVTGKRANLSAATGEYVILRGSTITGKADGVYTAAKAIPANTDLDGTYLTATSGKGTANLLKAEVDALNSNISKLKICAFAYIDTYTVQANATRQVNILNPSSGRELCIPISLITNVNIAVISNDTYVTVSITNLLSEAQNVPICLIYV